MRGGIVTFKFMALQRYLGVLPRDMVTRAAYTVGLLMLQRYLGVLPRDMGPITARCSSYESFARF